MIAIVLRERGATPRHMRQAMRKAKRDAYEVAGIWWHTQCRPKHFTREAYARYGYTPRMGESGTGTLIFKKSYTGRKLKKYGHTNPIMWSGVTERLSRLRDVRATSTGVRVVMNLPVINFRPKGGRIFLRRELETLTHGEMINIARIIDRQIDFGLNADTTTSQRTI